MAVEKLSCKPNAAWLSIYNHVDTGLIVFDNNDSVIMVNEKVRQLLGYLETELIEQNYVNTASILLGKHYNFEDIVNRWEEIKLGISTVWRHRFTHRSGQTVPLEVKSLPLYDNQKEIAGLLLILKDLLDDLLIKITTLVNSSLSLKVVLENTVQAVVEHLGLDSTAIFLLDENKTRLHLICCNAMPDEETQKVSVRVGEGAPGKVIEERKPIYVENLRIDPSIHDAARKFHGDKSSIGYPLQHHDELLGVIAFDADIVREFSEKEQSIFQNISNQVALAIYNAQLFNKLEHLSTTDGLTGLYNHRYFHELLDQEVEKSKRYGDKLCFLMLDVDYFKKYNDTFGHIYGDMLLKQLAKIIKYNVRKVDIVARYGGEEFAVILPKCTLKDGIAIGKRIINSVEEHRFNFGSLGISEEGKITISAGLAVYQNQSDKMDFIQQADQALYKAKLAGRNKLEILW
ncbi:MAG: sensor domain-containing diguanylate cyclase [Thermincola sp.]|nr:sensor domain-containing diguanylate cyclase [Thermincola sp.]MDT3703780.1 sensor domain-containing diguanylate cyclase [Thermincola sp.]